MRMRKSKVKMRMLKELEGRKDEEKIKNKKNNKKR